MSTCPPYPDEILGDFLTTTSEDTIMPDAPYSNHSELPPRQPQTGDLIRNTSSFDESSQRQTSPLRSERSASPPKQHLDRPGTAGMEASETKHPYPQSVTITHDIVKGPRTGLESNELESNELALILHELDTERRERVKIETQLIGKNAELEDECQRLEKSKRDWEEKYAELEKERDEVRKGWRKAAKELNKISVQGQGFYQVTDQFLIDKTSTLRYNIRNFTIQYFDGDVKPRVNLDLTEYFEEYIRPLTPPIYQELILSRRRCSSFVQAILWRVLVGEVFDRLLWAGEVANDIWGLHKCLRPTMPSSNSQPNPEAERKFQTWSATTTGLLLEKLDLDNGGKEYQRLHERKQKRLRYICETIEPFARRMDNGFQQDLFKIISDAVALDMEISKQVARVTWVFDNGPFNPDLMELEAGEDRNPENQEVHMIVAPGLKKRGKSTGDGFKIENTLLLMQVSCEPILASGKKSR